MNDETGVEYARFTILKNYSNKMIYLGKQSNKFKFDIERDINICYNKKHIIKNKIVGI